VLEALQDTYVGTAIEIPLGGAANLRAGFFNQVDMRTYVQFQLTSLPERASIEAAELTLWCHASQGVPPGTTAPMEILRVLAPWSEDDVIYKRRPNTGGPKYDWDIPACDVPGQRSFDLTRLVGRWHDGSLANYGIEIAGRTIPSGQLTFASKEGGSPSAPGPQLRVLYRMPKTTPPSPIPTSGPPPWSVDR
jgi:hypothetical protein